MGTEYFKQGIYSPFSLFKMQFFHNSNVFGSCIIYILYTDVLKLSTVPLTSKRCILYIYSINIGTEYFKQGIYSPFSLFKMQFFHNSNVFGSCIIYILYTECAKIKYRTANL